MAKGNETTTKFRVDISELKKGIQDANRQIRLANAEFKAASAGMDDWAKSIDGVSAKMQQTDKVLKAQKSILKDYEKQLELIEKEYGVNSKEADEMRIKIENQKAAVVKSEKSLGDLNEKLEALQKGETSAGKETDKLSGEVDDLAKSEKKAEKETTTFGNALKTGLTKAASAAGAALKAVGASIAAAAAATLKFAKDSVEAGADFDSSMSQVAATMGVTTDEIQNLRDYAQEMGSKTAFSASQAADALNYMALAGYDAETSMKMLPNVLSLAAAGGIELAEASDMVTDAQSALGLTIDETTDLVDKMAKASSKSNTSVAQLGEAILKIGGTAKSLSGGTTELATALGILADNGVKGAEGGTALRNIMLSLTAPVDKAADTMHALGLEVFDAQGNMRPLNDTFSDLNGILASMTQEEKTQVLSDLFNKNDLKSVNALLSNTGNTLKTVQDGLSKAAVDWTKYSDAVWAADGAQNGLIDDLIYNIKDFEGSTDELRDYLHFEYDIDAADANEIIASVSDSLSQQSSRWEELSLSIDDAAGAAQSMADTQLDNLNGDITLFKSALEGAQIAISDALTPTLREFVQLGASGLSEITDAFKEKGLGGAIEAAGGIFENLVHKVSTFIPSIISFATQLVTALANQAAPLLQAILPALITGVQNVLQALVKQAPALLQVVSNAMPMLLDAILTILPDLVRTGLQLIAMLAIGISEALPTLIPTIYDVVMQIADALLDNIDLLLDAAIQLALGLVNGFVEAMPLIADKMPAIIEKLCDVIVANAPLLLDASIQIVAALVTGIITNAPAMIKAAAAIAKSLVKGLFDLIKAYNAKLKEIGSKLFTPISESASVVLDKIKEFVSEIMTAIEPLVTWIDSNIIQPIVRFFSTCWKIIAELAVGCVKAVKAVWSKVSSWFDSTVIQPVKGFFGGMWDKLKAGAANAWDGIKSVFSSVSNWFRDTFSEAWQKVKDVFSTGGKIFDGIKDGIVNAFKVVVNGIIRGINKVVSIPFNAINGILDKIAGVDIAGIRPFEGLVHRLPIPQIPELSKGGILKRGQVGLLEGDGTEAVVPLENNKAWISATASELKRQLAAEGIAGKTGAAGTSVTTYNFNQTNNSPKALSRLEIYRQSKNLLGLKEVAAI